MKRFAALVVVVVAMMIVGVTIQSMVQKSHIGENLCPVASATRTALKSGDWEDPAVWGGTVPIDGDRVYIPCNCWVTLHTTTAKLQWLNVDGIVDTCDHCPTLFRLHTLYIGMMGRFYVGTPDLPINPTSTAGIEYLPGSQVGLPGDFLPGDFQQLSLGTVCHGEFKACGADKTAWVTMDATIPAGATSFDLGQDVTGWNVGDEILIAGTDAMLGEDATITHRHQSEVKKITAISGRTVTVDTPLKYKRWKWRADLPYHCANITRNVTFRSSDPSVIRRRGHMMFMSPMNDIRNARMLNLGRTDKSKPVTDPRLDPISGVLVAGSDDNPRARYSDHNHQVGLNWGWNLKFYRYKTVVDGSPGWCLVNHASNGDVVSSICLRFYGSGFTTEEGQELGKFSWCLAAMGKGDGDFVASTDDDHGRPNIGDWGTDGAGFWLQGGEVAVDHCVSFDHSGRCYALFNRALNSYPDMNGVVPWIQKPIVVQDSTLSAAYQTTSWWKDTVWGRTAPNTLPSQYVPQKEFVSNVGYMSRGLQSWDFQVHTNHTTEFMPDGVRGLLKDTKLWGRGAMMHLEYSGRIDIDGIDILGDSLFRGQYFPTTNSYPPILVRQPFVKLTGIKITGVYNRNAWPNPYPMQDVSVKGRADEDPATHTFDGTYPIMDGTGAKIR